MMERRWHPRKAVTFDVRLMHGPGQVVHGRVRDLSLEGMFIETGSCAISYHTPVELRFRPTDAHNAQEYRVPALVVRAEAEGLAVMYRNVPLQAHRALQRLVDPPH